MRPTDGRDDFEGVPAGVRSALAIYAILFGVAGLVWLVIRRPLGLTP
jgi:hypothetical protein